MRANAKARIPTGIDYSELPCLSAEEVEKLAAAQPKTLHDASLIAGITPKALLYLYNHISKAKRVPNDPTLPTDPRKRAQRLAWPTAVSATERETAPES